MLTLILMTVLGSALALGALYIGVMLFGYLLLAIGRWQMFEKMGQPGWKGFIPIYSDYVLYGSCWETVFFWIALAASAVCAMGGADSRSLLVSLAGIIAAVNHKGDSESTGAIAGNLLGAKLGYEAIPNEFKDHLELHELLLAMADKLYEQTGGDLT